MVCLAFFFPTGQDVNNSIIVVNNSILFFYLSEVSLLFDDVFLLQAKKI